MTVFLLVLFGAYGVFVLALLFGWARAQENERAQTQAARKITVVIPYRDEAHNIGQIINDLQHQKYPPEFWQVILVNDHSSDDSESLVKHATTTSINLVSFSLTNTMGKKAALTAGILQAEGELIVTTDADCKLPDTWLQAINNSFDADNQVQLVIGPVRIDSTGKRWQKMQSLELASLVGVSASTVGLGFGSMCSGANLAFKRSAFIEVGGYQGNEHISSGDDEFLMRKIQQRWPGSVRFLASPDGIVTTKPQKTLTDFVHQRVRWAGKWQHNSHAGTRWMALLTFGFHLAFVATWLALPLGWIQPQLFLSVLIIKVFAEALFLMAVTRFLNLRWSWFTFILLQLIYSFYVVSIGLSSRWIESSWKGRVVKSRR